jgi:hypothetical protein
VREALAAEHRSSLSRTERHGRLLAALRADRSRFNARVVPRLRRVLVHRIQNGHALRLAELAALGFVLELLVVKEELFPGSENEAGTTVDAAKYFVLKFHLRMLPFGRGA